MKYSKNYEIPSQITLPFLSTPFPIIQNIFKVLEGEFQLLKGSKQRFIDLGAGNGTIIIYCAKNFKIKSIGIEINKTFVKEARAKIKREKVKKAKMIIGDLFQLSLEKYDYIYIFSLPNNQRFFNHILQTAKQGATIISYKYPLDKIDVILDLKFILETNFNEKEHKSCFYKKI